MVPAGSLHVIGALMLHQDFTVTHYVPLATDNTH